MEETKIVALPGYDALDKMTVLELTLLKKEVENYTEYIKYTIRTKLAE